MIHEHHQTTVPHVSPLAAYLAFAAAGFRRYAIYRQAMLASIVTNSVFGFLRCSVLLALGTSARTR